MFVRVLPAIFIDQNTVLVPSLLMNVLLTYVAETPSILVILL